MERAGRFEGSRSSEPARSYYDYFLGELRVVDHYTWAARDALRGRFRRQRDAARSQAADEAAQARITRLEQRWVTHWLEYFRTNRSRYTEERLALWRFVLLNWSDFAGDASRLGSRATPLGWGVERAAGNPWYDSLDAVDDLLAPANRTRAEERAVAGRRAGSPDGFWVDIFNRHHENFWMLFTRGLACQQNLGQQIAGTRVTEEVHSRSIRSTAASDRSALGEDIPHWHQLRNSLMRAHDARFLALRQCYYRFWSLGQAPRSSPHLTNAGFYVASGGGWSVRHLNWRGTSSSVPGQPSRSPACGCATPGRRQTTITADILSLLGL
jgi:hypothetical protein